MDLGAPRLQDTARGVVGPAHARRRRGLTIAVASCDGRAGGRDWVVAVGCRRAGAYNLRGQTVADEPPSARLRRAP